MFIFPRTISVREIQRNYRKVFDLVKKTRRPIVVMRNNKPDVAIVDVKRLERLEAVAEVLRSREESRSGKAKILKRSLVDLWNDAQKRNR